MIAVVFLFSGCSNNAQDTYFDSAAETDSSLIKITEVKAVDITINQSNNVTSQYDNYDAAYFFEGTWHVLFCNDQFN